jgi:hypothetical protein
MVTQLLDAGAGENNVSQDVAFQASFFCPAALTQDPICHLVNGAECFKVEMVM